jgi:hypothetical protein
MRSFQHLPGLPRMWPVCWPQAFPAPQEYCCERSIVGNAQPGRQPCDRCDDIARHTILRAGPKGYVPKAAAPAATKQIAAAY